MLEVEEPRARTAEATDDHALVAAVRRGDDRAFEVLYRRHRQRIHTYVYGMVSDDARAEDITQEVFFSAHRRMRDTERPIAFKAWVYEIARNACIDRHRRTQARVEELSYDAEDGLGMSDRVRLADPEQGLEAAVERRQKLHDLCGAFGGLSETHHEILVLREMEGMSYREIGERMGLSRPAVESTLFRARRRLTEEYDELVSGRRCQRVQSVIASASEGIVGVRDQRRMARHISHCQVCRRQARRFGLTDDELAAPSGHLRAQIAALVPVPAFFRRGGAQSGDSVAGQSFLTQLPAQVAGISEPFAATWGKAIAAVATLALAGAGAHVANEAGWAPATLPGGISASDAAGAGGALSPGSSVSAGAFVARAFGVTTGAGAGAGGAGADGPLGTGVGAAPDAAAGSPFASAPFALPGEGDGATLGAFGVPAAEQPGVPRATAPEASAPGAPSALRVDAPPAPSAPGAPEGPGAPDAPSAPNAPPPPDAPASPSRPSVNVSQPSSPSEPDAPSAPDAPTASAPSAPPAPSAPSAPGAPSPGAASAALPAG